jgi:hypothetical protein
MGLEPTIFCMAGASDVRTGSRPFAQTRCLQGFRQGYRTRPNLSERRTLPFLPAPGIAGPWIKSARPSRHPRRASGSGGVENCHPGV